MWMLAMAVAIVGTAALTSAGLIDTAKTIYTSQDVPWLSNLVGGLLFGFGMTLASGCGSKTLIRAGAGNLKSLVVLLVLAAAAYMTLKGAFAPFRAYVLDPVRIDVGAATSDLPTLAIAAGFGSAARLWLPLIVAAVLIVFIFASRDFRTSRNMSSAASSSAPSSSRAGTCRDTWATSRKIRRRSKSDSSRPIPGAWSRSASSPRAPICSSCCCCGPTQSRIVTFGIAAVLGVMLGSVAMAVLTRTFRWEGFASVSDLSYHLLGGVLMGFGGVTALGCTIGQGLTGISTLAIGSVIALASIIAGGVAGIRFQMGASNVFALPQLRRPGDERRSRRMSLRPLG